jgi:hypothetical protein
MAAIHTPLLHRLLLFSFTASHLREENDFYHYITGLRHLQAEFLSTLSIDLIDSKILRFAQGDMNVRFH